MTATDESIAPAPARLLMEFHDSDVEGVTVIGPDASGLVTVVFHFRKAYLHRWEADPALPGTGWVQPLDLQIDAAEMQGTLPDFAADDTYLWSGELTVDGHKYDLVPVPLEAPEGRTRLHLIFICGQDIAVVGRGVSLRLQGTPRYVEKLPEEFRMPAMRITMPDQ